MIYAHGTSNLRVACDLLSWESSPYDCGTTRLWPHQVLLSCKPSAFIWLLMAQPACGLLSCKPSLYAYDGIWPRVVCLVASLGSLASYMLMVRTT